MIERGVRVGDSKMFRQDKIWSRYSNDKINIGEVLSEVLRTLMKALPLSAPLRAFSIGSSNEPQFRILEAACRGGLYLLDIEESALDVVKERVRRQQINHVKTLRGNYNKIFHDPKTTRRFIRAKLGNEKVHLITFHHSLYYCVAEKWRALFDNVFNQALGKTGAIHSVLMAADPSEPYTTSWLYEHFAGKYFGHHNNQDLQQFAKELRRDRLFRRAQILTQQNRVPFFVDDFQEFMAVIWMILLYPKVHHYTFKQREEITEFVYKKIWKINRPLVQIQDHMVIYRGIPFRGLPFMLCVWKDAAKISPGGPSE